jgi:putative FmdB family regulatory protein
MPVYEYRCNDCNERYDILHKSSTNLSEVVCPKCGSENYKKLLSTFSASGLDGSSSFSPADIPSAPAASPCANGMCGLN